LVFQEGLALWAGGETMHILDLDSWPRRQAYAFFRDYDYPHVALCANVDVTATRQALKARGHSFTIGVVYLIARVANDIREFRLRIRDDQVVEHELVHPGFTFLVNEEAFAFCWTQYRPSHARYAEHAAAQVAATREHPAVEDEPGKDDVLYLTAIPWVSFTSFMHPLALDPCDSVPRFAWGKYLKEHDRLLMPLSVQGHHALMDGIHIGRYYQRIQKLLDQPETWVDV
jgi:chloramphenicol O-acetyltransferase type A